MTAAVLNGFDVVIVQHEFGIYDLPDGRDVVDLLADVTVPVITVVHTVPMAPTISQRRILQTILNVSDRVVVLSHSAGRLLRRMYRVRPGSLRMIPHGAPDLGRFRLPVSAVRPQILTWGLIGRGKGIEYGVEALSHMTEVLDAEYVVAGATHPKVLAHEGEAYRERVQFAAESFGVASRVHFVDDYLDATRLQRLIAESAAFLLPYDSREQVTSGVLIEAIAAGGPVIATRFPHAVELLGSGAGILVGQQDPYEMAEALDAVLSDPELQWSMRARARVRSQGLQWEHVGRSYVDLADGLWRGRAEASAAILDDDFEYAAEVG